MTADPADAHPSGAIPSEAAPSDATSSDGESAPWLDQSIHDAVVRQSMDAIVLTDLASQVRVWNPAAERLYGVPASEAVGRQLRDVVVAHDVDGQPLDGDAVLSELESVGSWRKKVVHRVMVGLSAGEDVTVEAQVSLVRGPDGATIGVLSVNRDATERTRLQAELVHAQKMEAIGLLVAGVAHELNNPLAAIVAFSQLIRTDPGLPADLRTQADLLVQEANRTRVIVQNLLDFARQRPPERVAVALRPLVESTLGLQSYVLLRNNVSVEVDIPTDLPTLLVDRSQLQQVLINLTVNSAQAIRALGRPGSIRIEAREASDEDGPMVRISVSDDGPGIPPEIIDRLFMPFVTTKEPGAGTGLGLSVSFGIIASHGGTLRHEPRPGGGATFVIELPVGRDEPDAELLPGLADPTDASAVPEPPERTAASGRRLRVLVLDDERSIRDFLGRVLTRSGYEPILAGTGAAALEMIRADPPDAILCDHRMAGMSGTEFHAIVSEIDPQLGHRFAFMSGDVLNTELRDFAVARGVQLLAKPFDIAAVASIVAALVAPAPA